MINVSFPTPVRIERLTAVTVREVSTVNRVEVLYRGPPGVSGNEATLSGIEGNVAYIEEDGGIYVPAPQLSSSLW